MARGPARVPAGTPNGRRPTPKALDPMDPKVPLVVDGQPVLRGAQWAGAYFLFDMAAEMWLETTSGKPISYFEPTAGLNRPVGDSLLWFVAGLRDWHRDGYGEHADEDDLTVAELAKAVSQRTMVALSYCASNAWQSVIPNEMAERMAQQQREQMQPLILAAIGLGWPVEKALEATRVPMSTYLSWQMRDESFRDNVRAALAAGERLRTENPDLRLPDLPGAQKGGEAPSDDPLGIAGGSEPGAWPASNSESPTSSSGN